MTTLAMPAVLPPADDAIASFKAKQRQSWGMFVPLAIFTTPAAASLVDWAGVRRGESVLDVATGTGVVAITAARVGAKVEAIDLSPVLLEEARKNAAIAGSPIQFREGDVEALPYGDGTFDVVLSQFGHMFAPRPHIAIREMLRVLKPGGRIAFSTWPPELMVGQMFTLVGKYLPPAPEGVAAPPSWGDPQIVRERLGAAVTNVEFHRDELAFFMLSPAHYRAYMEANSGSVAAVADILAGEPDRLARFRTEFEALITRYFRRNRIHQSYLMTRATKK